MTEGEEGRMYRLTRRMLISAALICGVGIGPAFAQGLTGSYVAQGRNPDGSAYTGTVQITQSANVVSMAWQVGASSYIGTGVQDGRVVTVKWGANHPVIYVVMGDGSLHGTWDDGRALERLVPN